MYENITNDNNQRTCKTNNLVRIYMSLENENCKRNKIGFGKKDK